MTLKDAHFCCSSICMKKLCLLATRTWFTVQELRDRSLEDIEVTSELPIVATCMDQIRIFHVLTTEKARSTLRTKIAINYWLEHLLLWITRSTKCFRSFTTDKVINILAFILDTVFLDQCGPEFRRWSCFLFGGENKSREFICFSILKL